MSVNPIPDGYHAVTPHLVLDRAAEAIEFYKNAFGAEETFRMPGPDGKIMHAEIRIGDSTIMLADEYDQPGAGASPRKLGNASCALHIYTVDTDGLFDRAVAAGATPVMPPADVPWGDRYGKLVDPFGHHWSIATHIEDVAPDEIARRMEKMMSGGG